MTILDNENTLHIRCGSDIRETLLTAGFIGDFLEFSDPFCQGPLISLAHDDFIKSRSQFISDAYIIPFDEINMRQKSAYEALNNIGNYKDVTLWFEHDIYDQLILIYLLNYLSKQASIENTNLICIDHMPGVDHFIGLGQLSPDQLTWLWEAKKTPLTQEHLNLGENAWKALINPNPNELYNFTELEVELAVAPMKNAITRHLQQLPSKFNGLSLTQKLVIEIVSENEGITGVQLFKTLMNEREPLPYLGDMMFWYELSDLNKTSKPLFHISSLSEPWPERRLKLTEVGREILQGTTDFLDLYLSSRWVGGVEITGQKSGQFRWDDTKGEIFQNSI